MVRLAGYIYTKVTFVKIYNYYVYLHWSYNIEVVAIRFINLLKESMDVENINKKYKVRIVLKEVVEKSFKKAEASIESKTSKKIFNLETNTEHIEQMKEQK